MNRREFIEKAALGGIAVCAIPVVHSANLESLPPSSDWSQLCRDLLKDWCDGMLLVQINNPSDPSMHGALDCLPCGHIHGRCMDAVYPFFHMADVTGERKYLEAGVAVFQWAERNVSQPDGSWTVIQDPKSWRGITVFGAIALAETLKHHGDLLEDEMRAQWTARLRRAADFIHANFDWHYSNVNYAYTAVYGLYLLGEVLDDPRYAARSKELASGVKRFMTEPNKLVFGEGKPVDGKSPKGLLPVDLGYNVEESLNNVVLYALHARDQDMQALLTESLESHLEFMLPDGAWDNSWGTRQAKWSYWGSLTADGCQQAYGLMADRNPAFGTAAYLNTCLLKRCTKHGLLHGGLHYFSRGVKPCVHHTFTHAKSLAAMLDAGEHAPAINHAAPLPRQRADGVRFFPEVQVWLAARGPWRATVSAYDWVYRPYVQQATGGSLAVLWNEQLQEPLFAASMAEYMLVEKNNQQQSPEEEDYALTPRIEVWKDGRWYTNLYDLEAEVSVRDQGTVIRFEADVHLVDRERSEPPHGTLAYRLEYQVKAESVILAVDSKSTGRGGLKANLALPIISRVNEPVCQVSANRIEIQKKNGIVCVTANIPLRIKKTERGRVFNLVPGFEAVPVLADLPAGVDGQERCEIVITVLNASRGVS